MRFWSLTFALGSSLLASSSSAAESSAGSERLATNIDNILMHNLDGGFIGIAVMQKRPAIVAVAYTETSRRLSEGKTAEGAHHNKALAFAAKSICPLQGGGATAILPGTSDFTSKGFWGFTILCR